MRTRLLLFFIFLSSFACAQVSVFHDETTLDQASAEVRFYPDTSKAPLNESLSTILQQLRPFKNGNRSLSFRNERVWISVKPIMPALRQSRYLMIRNPHINFLKVWYLKGDSVYQSFNATGDRLPFRSRPIYHADYIFRLDSVPENFSLLILADKRNEMLTVPVHFLTGDGFFSYDRKKNHLSGVIFGLSLFLFFFNLFLFLQMKERLYVFYGLYILFGLLYILSDAGYVFMFLFPGSPEFADYMRPVTISLATPMYLLFSLEFLDIRNNLPRAYKWMMTGLSVYFLIFLVSIPFMNDEGKIRVIAQYLMQFLLSSMTFGNLVMSVAAWKKKVKYSIYIIITSVFLLITITFFTFYLSGDIPDTFLTRNLMNIGFVGEITILAFALSLRFKYYKERSEELLRTSNLQQEQIFRSVTDYHEQELKRLSGLLHDSIGARLSALRYNLESSSIDDKQKIGKTISEISELSNEVRGFSHSMSPILLQKKGLKEALQHFIEHVNESDELEIQFEMIGSLQSASYRYELLIYNTLQELLQNIIRHAEASEAIVQLMLENDLVSIFVEDNGKGFSPGDQQEGLGLSQIRQLVKFVNGALKIDSAPSKGTRISIEFILLPDDKH